MTKQGALAAGEDMLEGDASPTARIDAIDAAKGIGIILVVVGHALRGIHQRGLIDTDLFSLIDTRIYMFHMPLFFMIAGMFFLTKLRKTTLTEQYVFSIRRLLFPLLLWHYIFLCVLFAAGQMANNPITVDKFAESPIPGQYHLWFLWALLLIHLLVSCLKPMQAFVSDRILALAVLTLSLVTVVYARDTAIFTPYTLLAIKHLPYFAFGMLLGALRRNHPWSDSPAIAVVSVLALALLIAVGPTLIASGAPRFVIAVVLSLCVLEVAKRSGGAVLPLLGRASMAIFLAHTVFSAALREVLLKLGVTDVTLHLALGVAVGLIGPLILWTLAGRRRNLVGF